MTATHKNTRVSFFSPRRAQGPSSLGAEVSTFELHQLPTSWVNNPIFYELEKQGLRAFYGLIAATRRVAAQGPQAYQKRTPSDRRSVIFNPQASSSRAYTRVC